MGEDGVVLMDLSSFFLVEGSADSEAEHEHVKLFQDVNTGITADDDDAESYSCDSSESLEFLQVLDCADDKDCFGTFTHNIDMEIVGDQSGSNFQMWLGNTALPNVEGEEESKLGNYREVMDQMEDRLFWETCMAIGHLTGFHNASSPLLLQRDPSLSM